MRTRAIILAALLGLLVLADLASARVFTQTLNAATSTLVLADSDRRTWARIVNVGANAASCTKLSPATATNGHVLAANGAQPASVVEYPAESTPGAPIFCFSTTGTTLYVETTGDPIATPTPTPAPTPTP